MHGCLPTREVANRSGTSTKYRIRSSNSAGRDTKFDMIWTDIATVVCALKAEEAGDIIEADREGWIREVGERGGNVTRVEQPNPGNQCKRRNAMCESLAPQRAQARARRFDTDAGRLLVDTQVFRHRFDIMCF